MPAAVTVHSAMLRLRLITVFACAAQLSAGVVRAQAPAGARTPRGLGTIQGTVWDSLIAGPLPGALVSLLDFSRSTQTDRRGRYVLDSVPAGRQVVTFSHPDLDSIGLTTLAAAAVVTAGGVTSLPLAVPSHETFRIAACGTDRAGRDSGVVYGTVTDVHRRVRLAGASVVITWPTVSRDDSGHILLNHPTSQARTDTLGTYYACGVPAEYFVAAQAFAGRSSSGRIDVLLGSRAIARRDLTVSRDSAGAADSGGAALRLATLVGTVHDERGTVVSGAYATVDDVPAGAGTGSDGGFVLRGLPAGTRMLMVRHVGFFVSRLAVDLRNRDTARVAVVLREATVLDTLRVTATPRLIAELEDMQRRMETGFGYFLSAAEIVQHTNSRGLFESLPSVMTQGSSVNDFQIWMRATAGYCQPPIFIDGMLSDVQALPSLQLKSLAAVEIYPRLNPGLYRYMTTGNQECGVVLVWTKYAR
jgi:hypothetical protein